LNWKDKQVLVTGGAGFIGSHLVDGLLKRGALVTVVDNLERGKAQNLQHCMDKITFERMDLREPHLDWSGAPDIVFDCAAKVFGIRNLYNEPATMLSDNVTITLNVISRCLGVEKYVYLSSSCVYDSDIVRVPHVENDMGLLNSFYGWSKLYGELLMQAYKEEFGLDYTIARPFNVYGPRESFKFPHVIPDFIKQAEQIEHSKDQSFRILGKGTQTRSFTYIADLVEGLILCAEKGRATAYNLGSEVETQIIFLARLLLDIYGIKDRPIQHMPMVEGDVQRRCASSRKALRELGWKPQIDLKTGLEKTIAWYKENVR